jgi:hypothetical protein
MCPPTLVNVPAGVYHTLISGPLFGLSEKFGPADKSGAGSALNWRKKAADICHGLTAHKCDKCELFSTTN